MSFAVAYFDIWQPGYAGASVSIFAPGTNNLLNVFTDEALTVPAANPQVLMSMSQNGQNFGKFANPVYVGLAYEMTVNGTDRTAIINPPVSTLAGEDASGATVTPTGSAEASTLANILARTINVLDNGVFLPTSDPAASSATNNATLLAAIGKASASGGGIVSAPAGTYSYLQISIPARVLLLGQGRDVTVLQSQVAGNAVTFAGDSAGLEEITIDGVILGVGSVGVFTKEKNETRFNNVTIKRFQTNLYAQGGSRSDWKDLYLDNAEFGALLTGDVAASSGNDGGEFTFNVWSGGRVTNCTNIGVRLGYVDRKCWHNRINFVGFENNPASAAFHCVGARYTDMDGCWWQGNGVDITVVDGSDTTKVDENSVVGLHISDFRISSNMSFFGTCQDVIFERGEFLSGSYFLTTIANPIITRDCTETALVTLTGNNAAQWMRTSSLLGDYPNSTGVTTSATPVEAWSFPLEPGEVVFLEAKVVANSRNGIDTAVYHIAQGASRPGSTLAYDGQTANFTLGAILTGATSGATARITADTDSGVSGTLTLRDIIGVFQDNETLNGSLGGVAIANGVLSAQNAVLLGAITLISPAVETDATWACVFTVSAGSVAVTVTGAVNKTVEWTPAVQVTSG